MKTAVVLAILAISTMIMGCTGYYILPTAPDRNPDPPVVIHDPTATPTQTIRPVACPCVLEKGEWVCECEYGD